MTSVEKKSKIDKPTTGQILAEEIFNFNAWLLTIVDKIPRNQKFLLGDRIQTAAIDLMIGVVEATYTKERSSLLRAAQMNIEKLRFLFRLANSGGIVSHAAYEYAARQIDQIGRGLGGWRKAHHAQATRSSGRSTSAVA
jgi:hypothetical protein